MRHIERESRGTMCPGQALVAAGYAGLAGSCRIAAERAEELTQWFSSAYIEKLQEDGREAAVPVLSAGQSGRAGMRENSPAVHVPDWTAWGATEWEEAGEGGIYTALWNLSGAYGTGFTIDLRKIPVKQGTIEICERYELNPYRLLSCGCVVLAVDNGEELVRRLAAEGIAAAVIGYVREGITREVTYGDVRGFMERPREDEICRLGIVI